jgi:hypothetical protein
MADMLQLSGLVARGAQPPEARAPLSLQAAQQANRIAQASGNNAAAPSAPTDSVEVRTPATTEIRAREMEVRQQAVTTASAKAEAFERISTALERARGGEQPAAFEALRAAVETGSGTVQTGPNLAQLLLRVSPSSAQAVDPGLVETAMVEVENSLAATYGVLEFERRGLATQQVAVENENSARVELEAVQRAAERIQREEAEGQPIDLLEALRGPAINRNRVIELLLQ